MYAEISQNAHLKEIACKKAWFIKPQLQRKRQWKAKSESLQISKIGIETIRHPSGTPTKETRRTYQSTSGISRTKRSHFAVSGEF